MSLKASFLRNRATRGVKRILTDNPLYKKFADQRIEKMQEEVDRNRRIEFVENVLPKHGVGAELGVYKGRFSPILLNRSRAAKLHLIDPWYFLSGHWNWGLGNRSTVDAVVNILRSFKKEIEAGRVAVHVGDDRVVLATFPDHYFAVGSTLTQAITMNILVMNCRSCETRSRRPVSLPETTGCRTQLIGIMEFVRP